MCRKVRGLGLGEGKKGKEAGERGGEVKKKTEQKKTTRMVRLSRFEQQHDRTCLEAQ